MKALGKVVWAINGAVLVLLCLMLLVGFAGSIYLDYGWIGVTVAIAIFLWVLLSISTWQDT